MKEGGLYWFQCMSSIQAMYAHSSLRGKVNWKRFHVNCPLIIDKGTMDNEMIIYAVVLIQSGNDDLSELRVWWNLRCNDVNTGSWQPAVLCCAPAFIEGCEVHQWCVTDRRDRIGLLLTKMVERVSCLSYLQWYWANLGTSCCTFIFSLNASKSLWLTALQIKRPMSIWKYSHSLLFLNTYPELIIGRIVITQYTTNRNLFLE